MDEEFNKKLSEPVKVLTNKPDIFVVNGRAYEHLNGVEFDRKKGRWVLWNFADKKIMMQSDNRSVVYAKEASLYDPDWDNELFDLDAVRVDCFRQCLANLRYSLTQEFQGFVIDLTFFVRIGNEWTGYQHQFLLDTGSTECSIPAELFPDVDVLKRKYYMNVYNGKIECNTTKVEFLIDGIMYPAVLTTLSPSRQFLMGLNLLSQFHLSLDCEFGGTILRNKGYLIDEKVASIVPPDKLSNIKIL